MTSYPWRDLYTAIVVRLNVPPSEYWKMSPDEVSLFIDGNKEVPMYGSMTEDDVEELINMSTGEGFI